MEISMKKRTTRIISLMLVMCILILSLASCFVFPNSGADNGTDNSANDGTDTPSDNTEPQPRPFTLISKDETVNVVIPVFATEGEIEAADMISAAIERLGVSVNRAYDIHSVSGKCIYIGDTSISDSRCKSLAIERSENGSYVTYVIHTGGNSLSIYSTEDDIYYLAAEYLINEILTSSEVVLNAASIINIYRISEDEYETNKSRVEWQNRWDQLERRHGVEVVNAFKKLYNFYGDDVYRWIANLYDIENGGFYYANSARDYEGFLPDIESTTQALSVMTASGLTKHLGNDLSKALPEDIVAQTLEFVYSLYDESDGYFYHPQWGKNIGSARKGRDINSALGVITKLGGTVPEDHALNRLSGSSGAKAAVSKVLESNVRPVSFLSSESQLLAWLEERGIESNSHGAGHTIESSASQIRAAGYSQVVLDWLDSKQLDNGLWEEINPNNPYQALSGLLKIGSCYKNFGGQMKQCDKMIDSAIETVLSEVDPYIVIYVYNPWGGLKYALSNMKAANKAAAAAGELAPYDYDSAFAKVVEMYPEMIDVTIDKLKKFQKDDGSFSYYQASSAAYTQGTHVSLGFDEGDVNGTALGMTTMYTTLFDILGVSHVPLYNEDNYNEFIEILTTLESVEKQARPDFKTIDFGDGENSLYITTSSTSSGLSSMKVEEDEDGNMAFHVVSPGGVGDKIILKSEDATDGLSVFAFEFDLKIVKGGAYSHQIYMSNEAGSIATMLTVRVNGNSVIFQDTTSNMHDVGAYRFTEKGNVGDWIHLRMEYRVADGDATLVLYVNEKYAGESDNYYGKFDSKGNVVDFTPLLAVSRLQIYSMMSANNEFYIDNLDYEFSL